MNLQARPTQPAGASESDATALQSRPKTHYANSWRRLWTLGTACRTASIVRIEGLRLKGDHAIMEEGVHHIVEVKSVQG